MPTQRRKFTISEKKLILAQADDRGVNRVLREHNISYSVFARWKQQLLLNEWADHNDHYESKILELENENFRLKKIVANLVLDLEMKQELLKARGSC